MQTYITHIWQVGIQYYQELLNYMILKYFYRCFVPTLKSLLNTRARFMHMLHPLHSIFNRHRINYIFMKQYDKYNNHADFKGNKYLCRNVYKANIHLTFQCNTVFVVQYIKLTFI